MSDESVGSNQRAKQVRKKRARRVKVFSPIRPKGQLSLEQAKKKTEFPEWKGGLLRKEEDDEP
jgi:hypothetical protein